MKDTIEKFSLTTIAFHWIIAIAIICMLAFGLYIHELPRGPEKGELVGLHKSFGVLILVLASLRIIWRMKNKFPISLSAMPIWQERLVKFSHWFLLIATVMMPLSGIIMNYGNGRGLSLFGLELIAGTGEENHLLHEIGHIVHGFGSKLLIAFIVLHVIGAIKHQFIDKDGTISRMAGRRVDKNSDTV